MSKKQKAKVANELRLKNSENSFEFNSNSMNNQYNVNDAPSVTHLNSNSSQPTLISSKFQNSSSYGHDVCNNLYNLNETSDLSHGRIF